MMGRVPELDVLMNWNYSYGSRMFRFSFYSFYLLHMVRYTNNPGEFNYVSSDYGYEFNGDLSLKDIVKQLIKVLCFFGNTQFGGAMWFLRTLFSYLLCINSFH